MAGEGKAALAGSEGLAEGSATYCGHLRLEHMAGCCPWFEECSAQGWFTERGDSDLTMQIRFPECHLLASLLPREPAVSCGKNSECYWLSEKRGLEMLDK